MIGAMNGNKTADYVRLPILESVRRCGVRVSDITLGRVEVEASCPFCGDKPGRYHLHLNTDNDLYHCMLCGARGNSVSLYARLQNVSNAEAARDLMEYTNVYPMPLPPRGGSQPESEAKTLAGRNIVYDDMLRHLTLSCEHLDDLRLRGFSDERIESNMYRTLPVSEQARLFLAGMLAGFHDLRGIPGFHTNKDGHWTVAGKGGLLIPVRDKDRYIQGLQVRLDDGVMGDDGRRYRWLSSRYKENGTRSGNWIHVTGDISSKTAYLTEGPLKGDAASFHDDGALFICIAGINSTDGLTRVIRSLGIAEIIIAADMDKVTNKQVRYGITRIESILSKIKDLKICSMDWDARFKGIDDYYLYRNMREMRKVG